MNIPNIAKGASLQEIFDFAYKSLVAQGRPSGDSIEYKFICKYRGPNNTKCAVGMFIPDEKYNLDLDVGGNFSKVMEIIGVYLDPDDFHSSQRWMFFHELQWAHDQAARDATDTLNGKTFMNNVKWLVLYKKNMSEVAQQMKLTVPETTYA